MGRQQDKQVSVVNFGFEAPPQLSCVSGENRLDRKCDFTNGGDR